MTIPLGRPLPDASRDLPGWLRRKRRLPHRFPGRPAIPMRSCSRWGLPCRRRYRRRGALLPHPFTLAARRLRRRAGGLLSVALSLGSPPPGITRHRVSVEPGLSSNPPLPAMPAVIQPSGEGTSREAGWGSQPGGRPIASSGASDKVTWPTSIVILGPDPRIHAVHRLYSIRSSLFLFVTSGAAEGGATGAGSDQVEATRSVNLALTSLNQRLIHASCWPNERGSDAVSTLTTAMVYPCILGKCHERRAP
jgi:hypothetical protein